MADLDAVVAYGFRGSTRFHVPGHKAGAGADPGLRSAIGEDALHARHPAGHLRDRPRARADPVPARRAARRRGLRRRALVVPHQRRDAGQPRALPRARAARRAGRRAAQLARVGDRRARALRRRARVRRARVRARSSAWPTASRRRRCATALERDARARARLGSSRRPTTAWRPTSRAAPRSATPPACRSSSTRRGARTSASTRPAAERAAAGRRRGAHLDAQDRRLAHAVGDAARRADRADRPRRGRARGAARALDVAVVAADGVARRRAPPARRSTARRCCRGRSPPPTAPQDASTARPRAAWSGASWSGSPGVAGWDPLRIVIDVRATGSSGYEVAAALRSAYDVHVELATHATLVLVLGLGQPADALDRFTHDFATTVRRIERPGDAEALVRSSARARQRGRRAAARGVPRRLGDGGGRRRGRARLGRVDRRLPAGHPGAAAGRADHRRGRRATCASCASRARACTARATRTSAPSSCSAKS